MRYAHDLSQIQLDKPSILAIGVFDGVHRGHRFLISQLVETAQKCGCYAGLLSSSPPRYGATGCSHTLLPYDGN
jgi:riboflavin kinase/FMN adenylyltransferase